MNVAFFIDNCREILPTSKDLTPAQWSAYREKLAPFNETQLQRIFDGVLEHCKRFPTIADIYEQARALGFQNRPEKKAHTWKPTDCQLCEGSGLVAAFWSQEFEISDAGKTQILRLHYLFPYHRSGEYARRGDHLDVRTAYRCLCDCGAVETLDRGIPRWNQDTPETMRRSW